jgi:hypothetical protein
MAGIKKGAVAAASLPCSVDDCRTLVGPKGARGLCSRHYQRMLSTGSPTGTSRPSSEARFFAMVRQQGECWEWTGSKDSSGYGSFSDSAGAGRKVGVKAHRWSYAFMRVEIPAGLELDHLCRNRACVNPWHLEPVTRFVNTMRGQSIQAINARKTTCKRGHPFDSENTYQRPGGSRVCRACMRTLREAYEQRQLLKEAA